MFDKFDDDEEQQLNENVLREIDAYRSLLNKMIASMKAPVDPKVIGLLEMAVDMLEEQVIMDKAYDYPDCPVCDGHPHEAPKTDMLFFEKQGPSVTDLNDMFDTSWMKDEDS